jgi:hypothetical protein
VLRTWKVLGGASSEAIHLKWLLIALRRAHDYEIILRSLYGGEEGRKVIISRRSKPHEAHFTCIIANRFLAIPCVTHEH